MKRSAFNLCSLLFISALFVTGDCFAKEEKDVWKNTFPPEFRARIVKISTGRSPNTELLTVKYETSGKEETLPEYRKGVNDFIPKIGAPFCMAEDPD